MAIASSSRNCSSNVDGRTQTVADDQRYDIIINGGGIVGLSFLLALQRSPYLSNKKILLIEQSSNGTTSKNLSATFDEERKFSNRVSSLTNDSKAFFKNLDIWSPIEPFSKEINSMHVWADSYRNGITFKKKYSTILDTFFEKKFDVDDENVCTIVENNRLLNALNDAIDHKQIKYQSKLTEIRESNNLIDITINENEKLQTHLLIGCDGYNSFVRKNSTLKYYEQNLSQKGIVGTVEVINDIDGDTNDVCYQRFIKSTDSVLALLPLTENVCSFVLSSPESIAEKLMQLSDEEFVNVLNEALFADSDNYNDASSKNKSIDFDFIAKSAINLFDNAFRAIVTPTGLLSKSDPPRYAPPQILSIDSASRAAFPLSFGTTLPYMVGSVKSGNANNIVLIGDAAHRVHPLAGQGLNLGLGDSECLFNCLNNSLMSGEKLFDYRYKETVNTLSEKLFQFEGERQMKLMIMMAAIHSMQTAFEYTPNSLLNFFNQFNLVKNEIVRFSNTN